MIYDCYEHFFGNRIYLTFHLAIFSPIIFINHFYIAEKRNKHFFTILAVMRQPAIRVHDSDPFNFIKSTTIPIALALHA